jgi:hypothetical protein
MRLRGSYSISIRRATVRLRGWVVQVLLVAETEWRKYDMMRVFANEAEARSYALAHQIPLIME